MRVYRFDDLNGLDDLHLHDEEKPAPGRGEILLRVHAVSLNYRDIAIPLGKYLRPSDPGLVPTSDGAAEVAAVGESVDVLAPGDRVIGTFHPRWYGGRMPARLNEETYGDKQDGWLTEYKVVAQDAVVPLPDGIGWEAGATLPCAAATAWNALAGPTPVRAGQTVLTLGTGGVSIFGVQLAKAIGARVIATTSSAEKGERLRTLGADEIVDYRDVPEWGDRVRELTGGRGVDRVIEVGGPATIKQSLRATAFDGEVVLVGFLGWEGPEIGWSDLKRSGARVRTVAVGDRENLRDVVQAVAACGIEPVVDRVFDFDDARAAFAHLDEARHLGKIVIRLHH